MGYLMQTLVYSLVSGCLYKKWLVLWYGLFNPEVSWQSLVVYVKNDWIYGMGYLMQTLVYSLVSGCLYIKWLVLWYGLFNANISL